MTRSRLSTRGCGVNAARGTTGPSETSKSRCHRDAAGADVEAHRAAAWRCTTIWALLSLLPRCVRRRTSATSRRAHLRSSWCHPHRRPGLATEADRNSNHEEVAHDSSLRPRGGGRHRFFRARGLPAGQWRYPKERRSDPFRDGSTAWLRSLPTTDLQLDGHDLIDGDPC